MLKNEVKVATKNAAQSFQILKLAKQHGYRVMTAKERMDSYFAKKGTGYEKQFLPSNYLFFTRYYSEARYVSKAHFERYQKIQEIDVDELIGLLDVKITRIEYTENDGDYVAKVFVNDIPVMLVTVVGNDLGAYESLAGDEMFERQNLYYFVFNHIHFSVNWLKRNGVAVNSFE